uniref:Uncharacterized protein n=1 Tax=Setaria digitata TaxID=48799 RepID=A0A915PI82_9BILA
MICARRFEGFILILGVFDHGTVSLAFVWGIAVAVSWKVMFRRCLLWDGSERIDRLRNESKNESDCAVNVCSSEHLALFFRHDKCQASGSNIDGPNMLWTSQALVAEPTSLIWPHIVITLFSVSTMVSLLTLCISTHCCRNAKKNENPYGEIATTPTADASISTVISRNRTDRCQLHHPSRLSCPTLSLHERLAHRLSAPVPQSSGAVKRALPKLPELSARHENKNAGAVYSTIDRSVLAINQNISFLYSEGPTNPTYESIDVDPLYSKLENGDPSSVKRYDYPIFASDRDSLPAIAPDDVLYQSASQIYAGVSEDPYSSITSQTGGDANYDIGYSQVRETMNVELPRNYIANVQAESRTLDHLYSRIRRGPSMSRAANSSTYRSLPSSEFATEYTSSGSDKTSREPSYRYITVRESVDAIRQRLNEIPSSNMPQSTVTDICAPPVREHYYSSIGGSDYETIQLQISAVSTNQPSYDDQNVLPTSCTSDDLQPETISAVTSNCKNMPPKPPTSPIPLRTNVSNENNLQQAQPSSSSTDIDDEAVNNGDSSSNLSEKIRRLRTSFFDQELKVSKDLSETSSTDLRFSHLLRVINQSETSKQINSSENNRDLGSENCFDETLEHLPKPITKVVHVHTPENLTDKLFSSFLQPNRKKDIHRHKNITQKSRSHSFHEASIFGMEQFTKENLIFQQGGNSYEEQCCISEKCNKLNKHTEDGHDDAHFAETSLHNTPVRAEDIEAQSCSHQQSIVELLYGGSGTDERSVQVASLSFSHESVEKNG